MNELLKKVIDQFFYAPVQGPDFFSGTCIRLDAKAGWIRSDAEKYAKIVASLSGKDVCYLWNQKPYWVEAPTFGFDAVNSVKVVIAENEAAIRNERKHLERIEKSRTDENDLLQEVISEIRGKVRLLCDE